MSFFRNNWPVLLPIIVLLSIWLGFIFYVDPEVLRGDQYHLILPYEKFINGKYALQDLWDPKGGHRFPGYKLLFFLNVYWFGFSPKVEIMVAFFAFTVASIFMVSTFTKSFIGKWKILAAIVFALVLFNAQTMQLSTYSLISMRLLNFAGFLALSIYTFHSLSEKKTPRLFLNLFLYTLLASITILLFGRGWGMAAVTSIIAMILMHGIVQVLNGGGIQLRKHLCFIIILIAMVIIYLPGSEDTGVEAKGLDVIALGKYYIMKLGNANLAMFDVNLARSDGLNSLVGGIYLLSAAGFSVYALTRRKLDIQLWTALFLVYFSLAAVLLVSISRYTSGSYYFHRHNFELSLGAVGLIYLFFTSILGKTKSKRVGFRSIIAILLGGIICFGLMHNMHKSLDKRRLSQKFQVGLENNLFTNRNTESPTRKDFYKMECRMSAERCSKILKLMDKHNISQTVTEFNPEFLKRRR